MKDVLQNLTKKYPNRNKKASGDVKYFGITADSRVIVTFEKSEDGTMTATSVDVVTSE